MYWTQCSRAWQFEESRHVLDSVLECGSLRSRVMYWTQSSRVWQFEESRHVLDTVF